MKTRTALTTLAAIGALAAGCGSGDDKDSAPAKAEAGPEPVTAAERQAQLDKNPYAVRCSDVRNADFAPITRRVQYALADDADIPGLNRLQASQSIFYAITELCKERPGSHEPARDAVEAVRDGTYRAEL